MMVLVDLFVFQAETLSARVRSLMESGDLIRLGILNFRDTE